ncbi:MAG: uncharacterized protein KVP18_004066 [Porospora cf. gigantea A]|uniref:uncharacterized protein n=2 Tax=Porospora cf. gigantea A TaxID=2853593 RepID=UPI00355A6061|nr:MAG: hypothetical protein KVP18_004066 [Porospora cf. gigantea A]
MFDWWTIDSMGQFESASVCDPKKDADVVIGSSVAYSYDRLQEYTSAQEAEEDLKCRLSAAQGNLEGPFAPHDLVGSLHEQLERARQRLKIATANLALVDRHAIGTDKLNHGVELSTRAKRLLSDAHVLYERAHQAREERRALRQVGVNPDDSGQLFRFMLESDVVGKHELLYCLNLETSQMIRLHKRNGSHSKYESHPFCLGDFNRGRWSPVAVLKRTTLPTLKDDLLGIKGFRANSEFDISVADVPVRPDIYSVLRRAEIFPGDIPRIVAHLSQTAC